MTPTHLPTRLRAWFSRWRADRAYVRSAEFRGHVRDLNRALHAGERELHDQ